MNNTIELVDIQIEPPEKPKGKEHTDIIHISKDYEWTKTDIEYIKPKYVKLINNSLILLRMAKQKEKVDSVLQILVVIFGIISSFIINISSIDDLAKTYLISIFTLGTTLIGGINSIKKFGQNSGKYYSAYQEYKELITYINNIFVRLKADQTYEQLNNQITKKESKFEIMLPQSSIKNIVSIEKEVELEFEKACKNIENNYILMERETKIKEEIAKRELYRKIIEKKSYIFLQEIRLKLYREYVMNTKLNSDEDEAISVLDLNSYENYFRTNKVKTYNQIVYRYKEYIDQQLATYIISKTDNETIYDYSQIERELLNDLLLRYETNLFYNIVNNKVKEYEKEIIATKYSDDNVKKIFLFNEDIIS